MASHVRDKALLLFTIAVLGLSSLAYFLFQSNDPARCKTLLTDGFWLNPGQLINWQPAGCMLHTYRPAEATACLAGRRVVFVGGADTHAVFQGLVAKLDADHVPIALGQEINEMATVAGVKTNFIYDPSLSTDELQSIMDGSEAEDAPPALTVIGFGYEELRRDMDTTKWVLHIGEVLSDLTGDSGGRRRQSDQVVVLPMFEPNTTQLTAPDSTSITPEKVYSINAALAMYAASHNIDVAFAFNDVVRAPGGLANGMIPTAKASSVLADILLNLKCNSQLPKHYPYASTCCNAYPMASWVQLMAFGFVLFLIPGVMLLYRNGRTPDTSTLLRYMPAKKYHVPIMVMGGTVVYAYYCDRTNIFGKEQKQTSPSQFFVLMGIIIAASLYTLKTSDKELAFLNRDQTDEWKGWMQVAILVYHYVGVSKTPYIYQYMRVCPTSYLFMTGFGHTVYFLKKDEYSFKRFVATMLRLNLLNIILAYCMGNDWLLYYFAPLVTWNFFVIFGLLWAGHKHNKNLKFLFAKMFVAAMLNTAFCRTPGVMEFVWSILQGVLRMQGDLREWRFRVTLDQYSIFPGMIGAVLFIHWPSYSLPKSMSWPKIERLGIFVSVAIMLGYAVFEVNQPSKVIYNEKHPYVCWLPCCAFVILRNCTPWLRRTHNGFFAWVGRGSLETFLLQFHIWLAGDTAGLLMVGPTHQREVNALVMTVLFMWISSQVTTATGPVIEWIMGGETKPRPQLPLASMTVANGQASQEDKGAPAALEKASGVGSSVAVKGQASEANVQDPEKLKGTMEEFEMESGSRGVRGRLLVAVKDLRVRVALILGGMVFMNWTYYI